MLPKGQDMKNDSESSAATNTMSSAGEQENQKPTPVPGKEGSNGLCLVTLQESNSLLYSSAIRIVNIAENQSQDLDLPPSIQEVLTMLFREPEEDDTLFPILLSAPAVATLKSPTIEKQAQLIVLAVNALPAFLKLRDEVQATIKDLAVIGRSSLCLMEALSGVDTALGLSPKRLKQPRIDEKK